VDTTAGWLGCSRVESTGAGGASVVERGSAGVGSVTAGAASGVDSIVVSILGASSDTFAVLPLSGDFARPRDLN